MFRVWLCLCLAACGSTALAADEYLNAVMADNPIAYWAFEEDTGDFYDEVTGTPNALRGATTAMVAGPIGTGFVEGNPAIQTGGATGFVTVADADYDNYDLLDTDWTIEAWVLPPVDGWAGAQAIVGKLATSWIGYGLAILDRTGDGTVEASGFIRIATEPGGWAGTAISLPWTIIGNANDGEWYHLVASFDRSVGGKLYVDGVMIAEVETTVTDGVYADMNHNLFFGKKADWSTDYYSGAIDEVALYRTALVQAQVTAHYAAAGLGPVIPEPTTWLLLLAGAMVLFARKCFKIGRGK